MLDELIKVSITSDNIEEIFQHLLGELEDYLELKPLTIPNKVLLIPFKIKTRGFNEFDFGVVRKAEKKKLTIGISLEYEDVIKFIILREAYFCFLPKVLLDNDLSRTYILIKVSMTFQRLDNYDSWEGYFNKNHLYLWYRYKLDRALNEDIKNLFYLLRQHALLYTGMEFEDEVISSLFKDREFQQITESWLIRQHFINYNPLEKEEYIEFFRIIYKIFSEKKTYDGKDAYISYFKDYLEKGKIKTSISPKKFKFLFKDFLQRTYLSPNYQINWDYFNINTLSCYFFFNSELGKYKTLQVIEHLPFYFYSRSFHSKLGTEIAGYFVLPEIYIDDLKRFLIKLKELGVLQHIIAIKTEKMQQTFNCNYFRKEFFEEGNPPTRILVPTHKDIKKDLFLEVELNYSKKKDHELNLLDIIIINHVRWYRGKSLDFEQKKDGIRKVRNDVFKFILTQRENIEDFKKTINAFHSDEQLRSGFLSYVEEYKNAGFFYLRDLFRALGKFSSSIEVLLKSNSEIKNQTELFEHIKNHGIGLILIKNLQYSHFEHKKILFSLFSDYFNNLNKYKVRMYRLKHYVKLIENMERLRVFNFSEINKILTDKDYAQNIYTSKISGLRTLLREKLLEKVRIKNIENLIDSITKTKPPGAIPLMLNTIGTNFVAPYVYFLMIKVSANTKSKIEHFKRFFLRFINIEGRDLFTNESYLVADFYVTDLDFKGKKDLAGAIYELFGDDVVVFKPMIHDRMINMFTFEGFFDYENNKFVYTSDLFNEAYKYIYHLFRDRKFRNYYRPLSVSSRAFKENLFDVNFYTRSLLKRNRIRINQETYSKIQDLHNNLADFISNYDSDDFRASECFPFIKKINFMPMYQMFGLEKFYLYLNPIDNDEVDWKMFFPLGFKSLSYSNSLDDTNSYFFQYIFPYENSGLTYLNWISKSKKSVNEYIYFSIKNIIPIINSSYTITPSGFAKTFQSLELLIQKILFKRGYSIPTNLKKFNVSGESVHSYRGKHDKDFINIVNLFGSDIKKLINLGHKKSMDIIKDLTQKKFIFPYLKLNRNIGLLLKFCVILPELNAEQTEKIIKVFSCFNYGFVYEIRGEYYSRSRNESIPFDEGIYLKFYLQNQEIGHFKYLITSFFDFLKIKNYVILFDLVKGDIFKDKLFEKFKHPNPFNSHLWNNIRKIWDRHKQILSPFGFNYPEDQAKTLEKS